MRYAHTEASSTPEAAVPHLSVCVCTYKRPDLLKRLLLHLGEQETGGLFTYSIVVVDNDEARSAEATTAEAGAMLPVAVRYDVEARRSIALARNRAVANASGEFVALIDDDEFPAPDWLLTLFRTCAQHGVDGVLGPVIRHFDQTPPAWFQKSNIYDRRVNPTGMVVKWKEARTGNVLAKAQVMAGEIPFRPEFRAGEDQDFFWRKIAEGFVFIWCAEAIVYETIPPARWKRMYVLRKAALQGATAAQHPGFGAISIAKAIVAVPLYTLCLPFTLLLGQHRFMELLVKIADHSGKLVRAMGMDPVREEYVSGVSEGAGAELERKKSVPGLDGAGLPAGLEK